MVGSLLLNWRQATQNSQYREGKEQKKERNSILLKPRRTYQPEVDNAYFYYYKENKQQQETEEQHQRYLASRSTKRGNQNGNDAPRHDEYDYDDRQRPRRRDAKRDDENESDEQGGEAEYDKNGEMLLN